MWGEVYLPPTPLRLGPLAATVGPNSSIRTLYVNWGLTLAQIQKSCHAPLGSFCSTLCNFTRRGLIFDLYSYIGAMVPLPINVPRALCMGWPLPINVQRALCTVKAVSQTYRHPSARLRFVRAPISIHILGPWSPDAPNGKPW